MRDRAYEKVLRDTRIYPDLRGRQRRAARLRRLSAASSRSARSSQGLGDIEPRRSRRLARRPRRLRRATASSAKAGQDHEGPRGTLRSRRRGDRSGQATAPHHREAPARPQEGNHRASVSAEAPGGQLSPTSTPRSRCSPASATIFEDQGVEPSGQERYIADTFCSPRRRRESNSRFDQIESKRRRADDGDREARLQARLVRLRAVRGLDGPRAGRPLLGCPLAFRRGM